MDIGEFLTASAAKDMRLREVMRRIELAGWKNDQHAMAQVVLALRTGKWKPFETILDARLKGVESFHGYIDIPPPDRLTGDIHIGHVLLPDWRIGHPVFLRSEHLTTHVVVAGPSGRGKTFLLSYLGLQAHRVGWPALVFETETEFDDFAFYLPPGHALVFDVKAGQFKRNPFQPLPGESMADTVARLSDVFREMFIGFGVNILSETCMELHSDAGWVALSQLYELLKSTRTSRSRDRRRDYLESLLSPISSLVLHLRSTYDVLEGYPLDELQGRTVVLKLAYLPNDVVLFFTIELLSAISDKKLRDGRNAAPQIIIIDEAQRLLSAAEHSQTVVGEHAIPDIIATTRKRNTGLVVATQLFQKLPPVVVGNFATQIYFRQLDGEAARSIARSLALTSEQERQLLELPDRVVVVRHPNATRPFLVRVPDLDLPRLATEDQLNTLMASLLPTLSWKPVPATNGKSAPQNRTRSAQAQRATRAGTPDQRSDGVDHDEAQDTAHHDVNVDGPSDNRVTETPARTNDQLSKSLLVHLEDFAERPYEPQNHRYLRRKLSGYMGDMMNTDLMERGLTKEHFVRFGGRGSPTKWVELTDLGWQTVRAFNPKVQSPRGKGSFHHKGWQHKIADVVKERWPNAQVTIEDASEGKAVDVLVHMDGKVFGIEVSHTTRPEDEERNVINDLDFCDHVFVLAEKQSHLDAIRELVEVSPDITPEQRGRVSYATLAEFIRDPLGDRLL